MNRFLDFLDDFGSLIWILCVFACAAGCLVFLAFKIATAQKSAWRDYATSHHCVAKGKKNGELQPVFGGKGGFTMTEDQTIYVCDGGEMVIR